MPRTKVAKRITKNKTDEEGLNKKLLLEELLKLKKAVEDEIKLTSKKLDEFHNEHYAELIRNIRGEYLDMTFGELKKNPALSLNSSVQSVVTNISSLNQTKTVKRGRKPVSRSSSLDEGYLTTESSTKVSRSSSTRDRSRVQKTTKCERASRSLSRNKPASTNGFLTPAAKSGQANSFGPVTPKCKPNTPQILLRRPKQGEVALSFQGSPLMVNVIQDNAANINIPLNDGTVLSLQPQKGLRMSQIPQFDDATLEQLETLNQHINMVLAKTNF